LSIDPVLAVTVVAVCVFRGVASIADVETWRYWPDETLSEFLCHHIKLLLS